MRPRQRFAIREKRVAAQIEPSIFQDVRGKKAQLGRCSAALAFQPSGGQSGFRCADGRDRGTTRLDLVGNLVKEAGADLPGVAGVICERGLGSVASSVNMPGCAHCKTVRLAKSRRGLERGFASHP